MADVQIDWASVVWEDADVAFVGKVDGERLAFRISAARLESRRETAAATLSENLGSVREAIETAAELRGLGVRFIN